MMYELYYWLGIQGRGEFIRLALEEAGAEYLDVALDPGGQQQAVRKLQALLHDPTSARPAFAVPVLKAGELVIAQTANILLYLVRTWSWRRRMKPGASGPTSCS